MHFVLSPAERSRPEKCCQEKRSTFIFAKRFAISNAIYVLEQAFFLLKKLLLFLSDFLSICLSLHICLYDCLLAVFMSFFLSVCMSLCLPVYLSVCLFTVCLSVCLSLCCLFMTKPASQGWCPGHSCSCPSVVCQSRDYKRARVAHLLLCNRSRSDHKHRSHNFKITINPN